MNENVRWAIAFSCFAAWLLIPHPNAIGYGLLDCEFRVNRADPWEVELVAGKALAHFDAYEGDRRLVNPTGLPILRQANWELAGRPIRPADVGRIFKGILYHPDLGGPFFLREDPSQGGDGVGLAFRSKWTKPSAETISPGTIRGTARTRHVSNSVQQVGQSDTTAPLADADIEAISTFNGSQVAFGKSAADGSFSFSLPPGAYVVRFAGGPWAAGCSVDVTTREGGETNIVLERVLVLP